MPLKKGKKAVSTNIKELMGSYEKKGEIGSSKPTTKKKAQKQAVAIALSKAGKKKRKTKPITESSITFNDYAASILQNAYAEYDKHELKYQY